MAETPPSQADLARAHRNELDALQRLTATITEAQATITETSRERAAIAHRLRKAGLHLRTIARPMGVAEATAGRIAEAGEPGATLGG